MSDISPLQLVIQGTNKLVAYACPACGTVFSLTREELASPKALEFRAASAAGHCAITRPEGGTGIELRRFQRAQKLLFEEYDGPVYAPELGIILLDIGAVLDRYEAAGKDIPAYVWACRPDPIQFSAANLIDGKEDAKGKRISDAAIQELQTYFEAWVIRQDVQFWVPDFGRAVLLGDGVTGTVG